MKGGIVADLEGKVFIEKIIEGRAVDAEKLGGLELAEKILDAGGREKFSKRYITQPINIPVEVLK